MGESEKRLIIAIVLSLVFLYAYQPIANLIAPTKKASVTAEAPKDAAKVATNGEIAQQGTTSAIKGAPEMGAKQAAKAAPAPVKEEFTTINTPLFTAGFSNLGGGVRKWQLKKYRSENKPDAAPVNLASTVAATGTLKTRLQMNGAVEEVVLKPSATTLDVLGAEKGELVYSGTTASGLLVEKKYVFAADSYLFESSIKITNPARKNGAAISGNVVTALAAPLSDKDETGYHLGPIIKTKDKLIRQELKEDRKAGTGFTWLGLEDKYFMSAFLFKKGNMLPWATTVPGKANSGAEIEMPFDLAPGASASFDYEMFIGPKEYDMLVNYGHGLDEAIEFGMFDFMARPALVILNFFTKYVGNYGLAIILMTIILKVIFYPLTKKSIDSMKDMQKIQPQLAILKEKYKNDKQKFNTEMMDLYKRYKINPVGGCLPMIVQIPVFIALYEVLYVAIELRHAPFFLWITDLAAQDPYYITPILMGAAQFVLQKMTPTPGDPTQAKIMLIMPVVFTFMFLSFPAGLVLYWLVNNVLQLGQQVYMQKLSKA